MFLNLKDCLLNNKTVYRSQERFKCYNHDVYTEEVNKIALVTMMTKKYKHFNGIETYPQGRNAFKVYKCEMLMVKDLFFENYNEIVLKQQIRV